MKFIDFDENHLVIFFKSLTISLPITFAILFFSGMYKSIVEKRSDIIIYSLYYVLSINFIKIVLILSLLIYVYIIYKLKKEDIESNN